MKILMQRDQGECMNKGEKTIQIEACLAQWSTNGDDAAFDELLNHTFDRLCVQCKQIVGAKLSRQHPLITGNTVAVEVYQKRLRKALESEKVNVSTAQEFFKLTARHIHFEILDMLRKKRNEVPFGTEMPEPDSGGETPEQIVLEKERALVVMNAVEQLSDEDREVYDLYFVHGLSQYEIADQLQKTRNQVDSVCRRIKRTLGKALQGHNDQG